MTYLIFIFYSITVLNFPPYSYEFHLTKPFKLTFQKSWKYCYPIWLRPPETASQIFLLILLLVYKSPFVTPLSQLWIQQVSSLLWHFRFLLFAPPIFRYVRNYLDLLLNKLKRCHELPYRKTL